MIRTLVLTKIYPSRASYYDDWREAFEESPLYSTEIFNILQTQANKRLSKIIHDFDLIVLLHACTADTVQSIRALVPALNQRRGKLVCFVGNEGPSADYPMGDKRAFLREASVDIIATGLLQECGDWLYGDCGGQVVEIPHALNPKAFTAELKQADRPIDIGVRNFRYPVQIGDRERNNIIAYFDTQRFNPPLKTDISQDTRFGRAEWNAFLNSCRATVSTEANTWYLERDDATARAIRAYALSKSKSIVVDSDGMLRNLASRLPYGLKVWLLKILKNGPVKLGGNVDDALDFEEVFEKFFAGKQKCPVYSKCISSRHFDAVGTRTLQIMFSGRFNDALRADEHFIALKHDFSNIQDVLERFRDVPYVQRMVDQTYEHCVAHHTHDHRLKQLSALL